MVDLIRGFFLKLSWTRIWEMYFGCTVPIFPTMQSSRWFVESRRVQRPLKIFTFVCLEYSRYDLPVNTNWIPVGIVRLEGMIWENPKFHFQKLKGTFIHGIPNPRIQAKGTNPIFSWPAEHEGHHKTWTLVLEASDSWFLSYDYMDTSWYKWIIWWKYDVTWGNDKKGETVLHVSLSQRLPCWWV